ncbi:histidinol-phosphate aminotransferase [Breznakia sp. PF5-3]|uniref:histidinol-phosphate transaminase n=1 Tax=unclassified Breznakia TaxID=2623764 RepID=UPI002405F324|nr:MULTISPECIES: histidinol-phosphate transaminase [unclassified Breznakia]MDF9825639.1 histidinol-phosphate aminotransferase [Breznakia sp. PM6-1]MDF9836477.1 histidinol-phosphate aminotransferase [Breznakia sp. PF5-3]MDF9838678.1 histidinol-phosphate aminotransferase [Breznakia sp. PFB2-8]MDF9860697.1 histidinol-phosphate aminotransferase [Breznakia sp. PH5-24]
MKDINAYEAQENQGLLLNANENPNNIRIDVREKIAKAILDINFNRYPDDQSNQLREAYSEYIKIPVEQIIVGNGSDEMLGLMINLNLGEGKKLYTVELDFSMYDYYTSMQGGEVIRFPFAVDDEFDVNKFIAYGKEKDVDMLLFSNPNNPTGKAICNEDIITIVEAFRDKIVIIDEAYSEFNDASMVAYTSMYANLLITRTLSKAFALAGIRCGFLIGNEQLISRIMPYKVPYNVNTLTQTSAIIALQYKEETLEDIKRIKKLRDEMYESYNAMQLDNVKLYPSKANYLFGITKNKEKLLSVFENAGILIRNYEGDSFRITIGNKEDNDRVLALLATI